MRGSSTRQKLVASHCFFCYLEAESLEPYFHLTLTHYLSTPVMEEDHNVQKHSFFSEAFYHYFYCAYLHPAHLIFIMSPEVGTHVIPKLQMRKLSSQRH